MLAIILKILSILGIVLLVLLCLIVFVLMLVLFVPIVYRFEGAKQEAELTAGLRVRWLFGLLGAKFDYPEPGRLIVRILMFTIFDSGSKKTAGEKKAGKEKDAAKGTGAVKEADASKEAEAAKEADASKEAEAAKEADVSKEAGAAKEADASKETGAAKETDAATSKEANASQETETAKEDVPQKESKLLTKFRKIKYTIRNLYDKIKNVSEEMDYYRKLLQDEETKLLFRHACRRLGKILMHIRPRKLKADIVFGTGSPDTTGYAYGIYGMLSPRLGKDICITPDFEEPVLTGRVYAAGHITVFQILINAAAFLLDRRLRLLISRLKRHLERKKTAGAANAA